MKDKIILTSTEYVSPSQKALSVVARYFNLVAQTGSLKTYDPKTFIFHNRNA